MEGEDFPARWSSAQLAGLLRGSSAWWMRTVMIPRLVERGVLHKVGRAWIGRRSEIESALLSPNAAKDE